MAETETKNQKKITFKEGIVTYFKGVKSEWGKVTWPEKNQIIGETIIVVIVVAAFTLIVLLMDKFFQLILGLIK